MTVFPAIESCKPSAEGTGGIHGTGKGILPMTETMLHSADCMLLLFHVNGSFSTRFCTVCKDKGFLLSVPFEKCEFLPYPLCLESTPHTEITNAEQLFERFILHEISLEYPWKSVWFCFGKGRIKRNPCAWGISRCSCHARVTKDLLL